MQLWKKSVFDQSKLELIESAYLKDTETVRLLNPVPQFSNQIIPTKNMRDPRNNLANNTVLQPTIMQPIMQPIIQPAIQPALPDSLIASLSSNYTVAAALLPLLQQAQAAGQQEQFLSILSTPEGLAQITSLLYNGQLGSLGIQQPQANPLNFDYDEEDGIKKKAPVAQPTINQTSLNQTALNQTSLLNQTAFNQTALNQTALTQSAFNQPRHSIDINRNVANLS